LDPGVRRLRSRRDRTGQAISQPAVACFTPSQAERDRLAGLSSGRHTALIRWRTDLGSEFCVDARSLIILHR
jgi:hypothetical protein